MPSVVVESVAGTREAPGTSTVILLLTDSEQTGRDVVAFRAPPPRPRKRVTTTDSLALARRFDDADEARAYWAELDPESRRGWTATIVPL